MNVDLARNPKQEEFFNVAMAAAFGKNEFRKLHYGGAIRGGKTFVALTANAVLAKNFKGWRSHIIRSDFPALQGTSIPSMEKILAGTFNWKWNREKSNYFVYHQKSDGKIFFRGENFAQDPELYNFLGLETNSITYEQIEEINIKTYEVGNSRVGSWYIDPMPTPLTFTTFNPTQTWIKAKVFDPWKEGKLIAPDYFQHALPSDNAFVTEEQWKQWGNLADRYQRQFIEGDWTDFSDKDNLWAFAFDRSKHVPKEIEDQPTLNRNQICYLSFDFNRNPICCSVIQWYNDEVKIIETIKLNNSDIYKLCDYIKVHYSGCTYLVTGDASGKNSQALVRDNLNYYTIIKAQLGLANSQIRIPNANPRLEDNQVLFNSIMSRYKVRINKTKAAGFIFDCENVKMLSSGAIDKTDRNNPTMQADALDTVRYWFNIFMGDFLFK